ncbi:S-adenosyl-L-methionine-dependent methyltransferase [Roridomyces roridus]|uniref:S-adenosyl-L-methionine-dependent methyltransferase n=1 Tax=Roridomyces roridus TaxID=1738132 RepID=A0AAD7BWJ0_9AGAR|nr:S-adenosyl-L-methionine-dependent methyltransferase [Roridomyces roridus]
MSVHSLYDRSRPSYQSSALAHMRHAVKHSPPLNVVEIGAGTGIFTRALLAHPDWASDLNQLQVFEPSEGMRDVFSKTVSDPRISLFAGTFQQTSVETGWADVVIIAQAFHWCPDFALAAKEIERILKPGGVLCLIWNLEARDAAKWVADVRDRIEMYEKGSPQYRLGLWRQFFELQEYQTAFGASRGALDWLRVVDRAFSKSYMTLLTAEEKANVRGDIIGILNREGAEKVWIDETAGVFEYPYKTDVVVCRKK